MSQKDLYDILGVNRSAGGDEIKKRYRDLARKYHPDRNDSPSAEARFKEISAAFAVLGDASKRKTYDEFGADGLREGFDPEAARNYQRWSGQFGGFGGAGPNMGFGSGLGGFGDLEDLLGSLFGGGMGGFGSQPSRASRPGRNVERRVTLSLRQAAEGGELPLAELGGQIKLPPGVFEGQKLRLSGRGEVGPTGRGDLLLHIAITTPLGFERRGKDLHIDVPLTPLQAFSGSSVAVPTPEGSLMNIKVPSGSQGGRRLRIRNRGMLVGKGDRGDLFFHLHVRIPEGDDPRIQALLQELEHFYDNEDPASEKSAS